ncbi:MAG: adenylate/guanylate cyclase domain-containing protein [Mariprofundaceae bacterium]|nr:adenylate/guanylate cyclase domain-containing protein [Mariprofundaceae bacterium]
MHSIFSETDAREIASSDKETVLESSLNANIQHTHVCGGHARCSTCRIQITGGLDHCRARNDAEQQMQQRLGLPDDIRLACQTRIDGDIRMRRLAVDDLDTQIIRDQLSQSAGGAPLGREKNIAVMFADLSNYTEFTESLPAFDVVHVLNRYYLTMNNVVEAHHGVISDVAGDGMLVLFGACGKETGLVMDAIRSIRAMQAELATFNEYLQQMYNRLFGLRAGISYGTAIVGNFSTGPMSKIAAIGDVVNFASRIEHANRQLGTQVLISEAAYKKVDKGEVTVAGTYACELKGKSGTHTLYEIAI